MTVRVLYVEDDAEIRTFVETLLTAEGYDVTALGTAEEGVAHLAQHQCDLVLTDYNLPGHNADWMLSVARDRGWLDGGRVVLLTGTSEPPGVAGCRVLLKPVDIDVLLSALNDAQAERLRDMPAPEKSRAATVKLRLYVTGTSRESQKAVRNVQRVLRNFDATRIELELCDVANRSTPPPSLEEDRVVVTPTLVRIHPLPKVWAFGDLSRLDVVEEMIAAGLSAGAD
ncbi:MAG TPA: circadian clock KaiB family protein [Vicinamibacterales bacterium]